jgi:hypothetical protein
MKLVWTLVCVVLAGSGLEARAQSALDDSERGPSKPAKCERVRSEAVYRGYGYDHEVTIENTCTKSISCSVKTNVNPDAAHVRVAAHATEIVLTFRGSPAREFTAEVDCKSDS